LENIKRIQEKRHEFIRQDFLRNGLDSEFTSFQPCVSSTPKTPNRRMEEGKWEQNFQYAQHFMNTLSIDSTRQMYYHVQAHSEIHKLNFDQGKTKKSKPNKKSLDDVSLNSGSFN
jgi:hypothetical protein